MVASAAQWAMSSATVVVSSALSELVGPQARVVHVVLGDQRRGQLVLQAAVCNLALERFEEARVLLELAMAPARSANAAGSLAMQLPWLATLDLLSGRWNSALAEAHEAVRLIEETGWATYRPTGLSVLARVEAAFDVEPDKVSKAENAHA